MVSGQWLVASKQPTATGQRLAAMWHYTRPEILQICRLLSEIALIIPIVYRFNPWAQLWPPLLLTIWFLLFALIPTHLSRLLSLYEIRRARQPFIILGLGLIFIILALRLVLYQQYGPLNFGWLSEFNNHLIESRHPFTDRDFGVLFIAGLLWWRGTSLIGRKTDIIDMGIRFRVLTMAVAPVVIIITNSQIPYDVTPFILLYLLTSLLAIAITRAEQVEIGATDAAFPITPGWLSRIILASGVVVISAGLITAMLTGDALGTTLGVFAPIWLAIQAMYRVALTVVIYLLQPLLFVVNWVMTVILTFLTGLFAVPPPTDAVATPDAVPEGAPPPFDVTPVDTTLADSVFGWLLANNEIIMALIAALIVGTVIFVTYKAQVQGAVSRAVGNVTRPGQPPRDPSQPNQPRQGLRDILAEWRRQRTAATIRRLYAQMSFTAAKHQYERNTAQTPYEYATLLNQAWPEHTTQIQKITQAYIKVRYGEIPETRQEFDDIKQAWETLKKITPVPRPEEKE